MELNTIHKWYSTFQIDPESIRFLIDASKLTWSTKSTKFPFRKKKE